MRNYRLFADQYEGNADPDLHAYAQAGHVLYTHKITQGDYHTDAKHAARVRAAHALGLVVMHYHYCDPRLHAPGAEAAYLLAALEKGPFVEGDLLALDFELEGGLASHMLAAYIVDLHALVRRDSGHDARIYGSTAFLTANCSTRWLRRRARWQAAYGSRPSPWPWFTPRWAWQRTDGVHGPAPYQLDGMPPGDVSVLRADVALRVRAERRLRVHALAKVAAAATRAALQRPAGQHPTG